MGISGTSPASSRSVGQGHHAVIEGTDVYIDDTTLELELLYDFRPESGQEFHLIKAHSEFRFAGITNGQVVDSFFDIDFIAHVDDGLWLYAVPSGTQATFHNGDWTDYSDHDPGSAVLIGGQMQFSENAQVGDLFIPGAITVQGASLETGSVQASHFEGFDALTTSSGPVEGWGSGRSTIKMNPSHWSAPSFDVDATWTFGIAGTAPAGSERQGDGHYANIQANSIEATGTLAIQMLHGFVPTAGDIFELMKGSQVVASFDNAKNGDTVWSNGRTTLHLDITSDAVRLVATRG